MNPFLWNQRCSDWNMCVFYFSFLANLIPSVRYAFKESKLPWTYIYKKSNNNNIRPGTIEAMSQRASPIWFHSHAHRSVTSAGSNPSSTDCLLSWFLSTDTINYEGVWWLVVIVRQHPPIRLEPSYSRLSSRDSPMNDEIAFSRRRALWRVRVWSRALGTFFQDGSGHTTTRVKKINLYIFYFIFVLCFMDAKEWRHLFIQAKWLLTLQHLLFEIFSNNLSTFQNECFMVSFHYCYCRKFVWFLMCRKSAVRYMNIST